VTAALDLARLSKVAELLRRGATDGERPAAAAPTPPTTATERRRLVIQALKDTPDATDREIARRHGVSPTTVGTLRRKLAADDAPLFRRAAA
jgi:DNA-binding CsgD family transcriptional regulator